MSFAAALGKSRAYRQLAKSGIVSLVVISVVGGYLLGQPLDQRLDLGRFLLTLLGVGLLAAGSSIWNQIQDRTIDARMPRTTARPLPSGRVTPTEAAWLTGICLGCGSVLLASIDLSLLGLGTMAVVSYNGLYTLWWKRRWAFAAVPGAIPGALPIWMGFVAAAGPQALYSPGAIYLFAILFFWQMPHFWVLAIRYAQDYRIGGIPTLSVARGTDVTLFQIVLWCLAYVGVLLLGPLFLNLGHLYMAAACTLALKLLWELRLYVRNPGGKSWLRFFLWINFSLILILAAAAVDRWSVYLLIPLLTR